MKTERKYNPEYFHDPKCRDCGANDKVKIQEFTSIELCESCINSQFQMASTYAESFNELQLEREQ